MLMLEHTFIYDFRKNYLSTYGMHIYTQIMPYPEAWWECQENVTFLSTEKVITTKKKWECHINFILHFSPYV